MNKKLWTGFLAVFVLTQVIEGFVDLMFLNPIYSSHPQIWRPLSEVKLWMLPVTGIFFSWFFVFIFSKGYESKGMMEGIRYGVYVALMVALPVAYGNYALMQIPYTIALEWFIFRSLEYVIAGAILSGIFSLKLDGTTSS